MFIPMESLVDKILLSIVEKDAVRVEGTWSVFSYSGDTNYHTHIFDKGEEVVRLNGFDLESMTQQVVAWFKEQNNTVMVPERFNKNKTII